MKVVEDPFVSTYNAAVEAYQADDLDVAWTKAQEAVKAGPEKANGYDLAAKIALKKKDWDGVIAMGEKSLSLEPDNPPLIGMLMEAYRAKGDKAKAAEYEKKYIAANPDQPDVIYNQAVELYNKGKFKDAEPLLLKVVEAKPDHAKAHYLLGMCVREPQQDPGHEEAPRRVPQARAEGLRRRHREGNARRVQVTA